MLEEEKQIDENNGYFDRENKNPKKIMSKYTSRRYSDKFTRFEEVKLNEYVEIYGEDWLKIKKFFPNKTEKELKERYHKKINPLINKEKFTEAEDELIMYLHTKYGNRWTFISKQLNHRSPKMVKTRYFTILRSIQAERRKRKNGKKEATKEAIFEIQNKKDIDYFSEHQFTEPSDKVIDRLLQQIKCSSKNDENQETYNLEENETIINPNEMNEYWIENNNNYQQKELSSSDLANPLQQKKELFKLENVLLSTKIDSILNNINNFQSQILEQKDEDQYFI